VASDGTDDERRWAEAEAESILHRHPTPSARARVRGRRRILWLSIFGTSFLGAIVAARSDGHGVRTTLPAWQVFLGAGCLGLSLTLIIWVVVVQVRSGVWGGAWRSPTVALTRHQRRGLYAQVRGKRPADPLHLPLSRDLARRLVLQQRSTAIFAALILQWFGQTIVDPDLFHLVGLGFFLIFGVVATAMTIWDTHRAQRFLDSTLPAADDNRVTQQRHSDPSQGPSGIPAPGFR
jgi:hypothetical protein